MKIETNPKLKNYVSCPENLPLIFNSVFSNSEFETLTAMAKLTTACLENLRIFSSSPYSIGFWSVNQILLDINQIVKYKNCKGYKYNCFLLRQLILNIEMLIQESKTHFVMQHETVFENLRLVQDKTIRLLYDSYVRI